MAKARTYPATPILAVSAAIIRDGKVLIVRRARPPAGGLYTLPGGGVEVGETLIEAVVRARPASAKGHYLEGVTLSATMSPGVHVDPTPYLSV